uniref:Reverse transcriptase domain-containing protein n=1 Tax=Tanacetum cinerariifolium TaxID=118510 RepID=A0A6L2JIG2_TANCI|nr:hypothetical protein [Tanacetum cinerariifolium]
MAEFLRAPTEGYAEAIVAWDRYKDLLRACPLHGFTELHQLDTFYNALNPANQDSLNSAMGGNLLERRTQDVLTIIEIKSKVRNSRKKSVVSQVKSSDANSNSSSEIAKLTHVVNQQTSAVTTAMTAILKHFQATPPSAFVKAVKEICVTCGGAHPYYQSTVNYNQGNFGYRPSGMANQTRPSSFAQPNVQNNQNRFGQPQGYNRGNNFNPEQTYQDPTQQNPLSELEKIKTINEADMKAMQTQINNVKNELRNEMKNSIQASMSTQTNELKNMMASFFQTNTASTSGSGSLPSNTIANPKGELKAITTRSGIVLDGHFIPIHPLFINSKKDERVEETLTDQDLAEYTIKVPPPLVQRSKPPSQRNFFVHQSTTSSSPTHLLEECTDELALITFPPRNNDLSFDIESDLKEIEYLLHHDPIKDIDYILEDSIDQSNLYDLNDNLAYIMPEMFTDEHALDYLSPPLYDEYDDDLFEVESDTEYV